MYPWELGTGGQLARKEAAGLDGVQDPGWETEGERNVLLLYLLRPSILSHKHMVSFLRYHVIHNINKFIVCLFLLFQTFLKAIGVSQNRNLNTHKLASPKLKKVCKWNAIPG